MLVERVPTRRKLLNLDTINLGFIRPDEPEDRQLAYCQAQLYAQYMLQRFGPDALIKMLAAYKRGLTTDRAIDDCFHVAKADFEAKYLDFLDQVVKTIQTRAGEEKPVKFSELETPAQGQARRRRPQRPDGLRALRPPRPEARQAVRRQGPEAQAPPPDGQLRQGPDLLLDRLRRRGPGHRSSPPSTRPSPTSASSTSSPSSSSRPASSTRPRGSTRSAARTTPRTRSGSPAWPGSTSARRTPSSSTSWSPWPTTTPTTWPSARS